MRCWLFLIPALFLAACNSDRIAQLEKQNHDLSTRLDLLSKQASLDLQNKCAEQARLEFSRNGWEKFDSVKHMASLTNHYNAKLNKCFMEVEDTDATAIAEGVAVNKIVSDAFERRTYGEYTWFSDKKKKYWEVAPFMCKVIPPSGTTVFCKSSDEFDALIKPFMEQ
jgi:hypothetical protein